MEIIGGSATRGSVMLYTRDFRVVARKKKDGTITSEVLKRKPFFKLLTENKYLAPKSIVFALRFLEGMKWWVPLSLFGGVFLLVFVLTLLLIIFVGKNTVETTTGTTRETIPLLRPLFLIVGFYLYRKYIAGYHAAEHMAQNAYKAFAARALFHMRDASRFNPDCISRFVIPGAVLGFIFLFGQPLFGTIAPLLSFVLWESLLFVDTFIGLKNIWLSAKVTELFQRYIATKEPTDTELGVAREALTALMRAHGEEVIPVSNEQTA